MGTVDIYHSRRTCYQECFYWIRDEGQKNLPSDWVLNNQPVGSFLAREVSAKYNQFNQGANVFGFDKNSITLESDDDLSQLNRGNIVKYNDELWMVDSVQRFVHRKESEFNREVDYKYTINLRR